MAKIPVISGHEAGRVFARLGFVYDHHGGSHMIYYHPSGRHLSIPDHNELDRGTLRRLIRYAGISVDEFVSFLQSS